MSRGIKQSLQLSTLVVLFLFAVPVTANPIHPYSEPIALGDQTFDVGAALEAAYEKTPWILAKESDELYLGKLSHKGFDVQVRVSVVNNVLTVTLDSVTETGCGDNCADLGDKKVLNWLVSMRRSITHELTLRVRDSLME
jgi:hypothetical protein